MVANYRNSIAVCSALLLLTLVCCGCSRAGGANDTRSDAALRPEHSRDDTATTDPNDPVVRLERMRSEGDLDDFVQSALRAAEALPDDPALQLLASDARLALGRNLGAEQAAYRALALSAGRGNPAFTAQAVKLWTIARFRQGESLKASEVLALADSVAVDEPATDMLRFWHEALAGRETYRLEGEGTPSSVTPSNVPADSLAHALVAVRGKVNGKAMPLVFIDTGGQHTLMTRAAAREAGVVVGATPTQLTGFVGMSAQAGLIDTLQIGSLVVRDVPVLVGDSPPLLAAEGQMSLGTDLMHHLRFTIDYPAREVTVEAARAEAEEAESLTGTGWTIPVWTFPQICLARGQLPDGTPARVLVDTGDRAGTFISYHWGRRNLPQLEGPSAALVFRYKKRNLTLDRLQLGSGSLADWPVMDTIPTELDRLNLVDIMLGRDLLAPYRLTIDLPARVLELHPGTTASSPGNDPGETHVIP